MVESELRGWFGENGLILTIVYSSSGYKLALIAIKHTLEGGKDSETVPLFSRRINFLLCVPPGLCHSRRAIMLS
jgi:hypothetical protein